MGQKGRHWSHPVSRVRVQGTQAVPWPTGASSWTELGVKTGNKMALWDGHGLPRVTPSVGYGSSSRLSQQEDMNSGSFKALALHTAFRGACPVLVIT